MTKFRKKMSFDQALEKAMRYCSYQERCVLDLETRFLAWNVRKSDYSKLLECLEKENFLDENRYVEAFVRGKFRIKKWGKNKLKMALANKGIFDEKLVFRIMEEEISEEDYNQTIKELIEKKLAVIKESDKYKRRDKLYRYMLSKGYESELISRELNAI